MISPCCSEYFVDKSSNDDQSPKPVANWTKIGHVIGCIVIIIIIIIILLLLTGDTRRTK